jgi:hypothetical protein
MLRTSESGLTEKNMLPIPKHSVSQIHQRIIQTDHISWQIYVEVQVGVLDLESERFDQFAQRSVGRSASNPPDFGG